MSQEKMTLGQLKNFDGREGRSAYVAVNGKVYDVSESARWQEGNHEGAHQAGADLSEDLKSAPHVRSVIERFPVVAELGEDPPETTGGGSGKLLVGTIIAAAVAAAIAFMVKG
ncbi:MAG: hypothetical protein C0624_03895 [Desulfuromonas sp.]|nr:MAG: hypothetical protein C0624_03895 [Desulfuromonas sp.]